MHRVYEPGDGNVLYFKRIGSPFIDDFHKAERGEWDSFFQVVRQTGTACAQLDGPNAHRRVVGTFSTEAEADAYPRSKGVQIDGE